MSNAVLIFINCIFISVVSYFSIGYDGLFIKRTVVNIPFGLLEKSVNKIKDSSNVTHFYFDIYTLENNIDDYLKRNIYERCDNYVFSIWPYKFNEYGNEIYNYDVNSIEYFQLHFKANYNRFFKVETYATYSLMEK